MTPGSGTTSRVPGAPGSPGSRLGPRRRNASMANLRVRSKGACQRGSFFLRLRPSANSYFGYSLVSACVCSEDCELHGLSSDSWVAPVPSPPSNFGGRAGARCSCSLAPGGRRREIWAAVCRGSHHGCSDFLVAALTGRRGLFWRRRPEPHQHSSRRKVPRQRNPRELAGVTLAGLGCLPTIDV